MKPILCDKVPICMKDRYRIAKIGRDNILETTPSVSISNLKTLSVPDEKYSRKAPCH